MNDRPPGRRRLLRPAWFVILVTLWAVGCASQATGDQPVGPPSAGSSAPRARSAVPHPQAFAPWAPVNRPLPSHPLLDPRSAAIVRALNAGEHNADYLAEGTTVFDAAAGGKPRRIICTARESKQCPLAHLRIRVNQRWKPSPGSDRAMVVVDYLKHRVYDLWHVATTKRGTVALSAGGAVHVGWGGVTSLTGSGQSRGATGSGLSHLYGMVRISEAAAAVDDGGCLNQSACTLASAIPHAVHIATSTTCRTYRWPAAKSDGRLSSRNCVPEGARLFLDAAANCAFDPGQPIQEAVCFALERYGAFVTDTGASRFAVGFEGASAGQPGGSGPSPYPAGGLRWDYYDMNAIPWSHLRVLAK